jgi:hypothetical protein
MKINLNGGDNVFFSNNNNKNAITVFNVCMYSIKYKNINKNTKYKKNI